MRKIALIIFILLFGRLEFFGQSSYVGSFNGNINDNNGYFTWAGTAIASALNSLTIAGNLRKFNKPDRFKSNAIFWIITGTFQSLIGVGIASDKNGYNNADIPAGVNICVGLATITTSIIRLASKSPSKENKLSYNFYYLPTPDRNRMIVGLHLSMRLN